MDMRIQGFCACVGGTRHDLRNVLRCQGPGSQDDSPLRFGWVRVNFLSFVLDA